MTDPPRMIRNKQDGMQDPSGKVVDRFGSTERLVPGFVSDDPESGSEESHPDGDGGVNGSSGEVVSGLGEVASEGKRGAGKAIIISQSIPHTRVKERVRNHSQARNKVIRLETSPNQTSNRNEILNDILSTLHRAPLVTMSWDSIQQLLDRKGGRHEYLASGYGFGFLGLLFEGGLGDEGVFLRLTGSLTNGRGDGHGGRG